MGLRWIILAILIVAVCGEIPNRAHKPNEPKVRNEEESGLKLRPRELLHRTLQYDRPQPLFVSDVVDQLVGIYENTINPLEQAYHYNDLSEKGELTGKIIFHQSCRLQGNWYHLACDADTNSMSVRSSYAITPAMRFYFQLDKSKLSLWSFFSGHGVRGKPA